MFFLPNLWANYLQSQMLASATANMLAHANEPPMEPIDDPRLIHSPYQIQYKKNYELLKPKYQASIEPNISFAAIMKYINSKEEERSFLKTVHCFVSSLSIYELNNKKTHETFGPDDWENFSKLLKPMDVKQLISLYKEIFAIKTSSKKWLAEEDLLLKKIIMSQKKEKRLPWKKIAAEFNSLNPNIKTKMASQCCERWKNVLNKNCQSGNWTYEEDLRILTFAKYHGTRWSVLARKCPNRSEHNVKNRFFSLLAKYYNLQIAKIKKSINYLDSKFIQNVIEDLKQQNQ